MSNALENIRQIKSSSAPKTHMGNKQYSQVTVINIKIPLSSMPVVFDNPKLTILTGVLPRLSLG
jgi:hypothetical protein